MRRGAKGLALSRSFAPVRITGGEHRMAGGELGMMGGGLRWTFLADGRLACSAVSDDQAGLQVVFLHHLARSEADQSAGGAADLHGVGRPPGRVRRREELR